MKKLYLISALIIFLGIASGISFFLIRDANAQIPGDITLTTMNDKEYTFGEEDDTIKLVEFIYTHCPDICPTTTQKMRLLKNDLVKEGIYGEKVQFVTVTIDPYRDTPAILRDYMENFGIENDGNWILLTGNPDRIKEDQKKIKQVADTFKFQYRDPGNGFYVHSTFTYLIDENNKYIQKFPMGKEFDKDKVFQTIMDEL